MTKRHTISVFIGDESGIINRIACVFAPRGYNIESPAVELNEDKALFTIVVSGTKKILQQVVDRSTSVEDLSKEPQVERELMLVKLNSYSSTKDQSVSGHLHGKRHGHINKHFDDGVTGDPGKMAAVLRNLSKFGIKELARTGKIALRREKLGETAPYWRFSAASYPDLQRTIPIKDDSASKQIVEKNINDKLNSVSGGEFIPCNLMTTSITKFWMPTGVFSMKKIPVDTIAHFIHTRHNSPGVLNLVTGVISRRGYNIRLAVGPAEREGISLVTTIVAGTDDSIRKLVQKFYKLMDVHECGTDHEGGSVEGLGCGFEILREYSIPL
ncbi:hypothetical protein OROHE_009934 [Orobanche hederae]